MTSLQERVAQAIQHKMPKINLQSDVFSEPRIVEALPKSMAEVAAQVAIDTVLAEFGVAGEILHAADNFIEQHKDPSQQGCSAAYDAYVYHLCRTILKVAVKQVRES